MPFGPFKSINIRRFQQLPETPTHNNTFTLTQIQSNSIESITIKFKPKKQEHLKPSPEIVDQRAARQANSESPSFGSEFVGEIGDVFGQGHGKILFFKDLDGNVVVGLRHRRFQRGDRSFESEGAKEEEVCGGFMV